MDRHLAILRLFLEGLGVPFSIDRKEDRKLVQKAVYLGQRARVDLGYRYGWYLYGPYSPSLARDYFALREQLRVSEQPSDLALSETVRDRLGRIRSLLTPPSSVPLDRPDWLELLASFDYQRKVLSRSVEEAREVIQREKSHLSPHLARAEEALQSASLV